ncbi:oxygenase MpaB family protein [Deminuibacter soli]|uniref:DUF2236 domain-containing protein n=1 Tax=Deminuibacter soli TaxID=2291815 RepID=A0A3E1NIT6_9BACT|nr:oxygenase MpaB family protein [Deminuibacter soli]RFM27849.1 DUF2236 domain-containing protein [Deminuibacter soli]
MQHFIQPSSIVREIWGRADVILVIFGGAAAEFALNKAVDWLYYTGRLPADPLGRLFSTVQYAHHIIFAEPAQSIAAITRMRAIHTGVETARGSNIPDWAYRDVLFMLIHYSIAAYELLERKLTIAEKEEVVKVFLTVGEHMQLQGLPGNYTGWQAQYAMQQQQNLAYSNYTADLFKQYRKHLGAFRYALLLQTQQLIISDTVRSYLPAPTLHWLKAILPVYKCGNRLHISRTIRNLLLPAAYKQQIIALDRHPA